MRFSVVIVCKNEEAIIGKTLAALQGFAPDVVVYDNGSTDKTTEVIKTFPVNLVQGNWDGFGKTKNKANSFAKHNWILSLDADEMPDEEFKKVIANLSGENESEAFEIRFKNFFGNKWLRYGEWGRDKHIRLFNKNHVKWNEALVHEELLFPANIKIQQLNGFILHYTAKNTKEYETKLIKYAALNAEKYFQSEKKVNPFKKYLSATFNFLQNYFFRLGLLDGVAGYKCAAMMARYTFAKYKKLEELRRAKNS